MTNPCTSDVVLTTGSSCLVAGWSIVELWSGSVVASGSPGCLAVVTDWTVGAGSSIEETTDTYSTYQEVEHRLTLTFADAASTTATWDFGLDEF